MPSFGCTVSAGIDRVHSRTAHRSDTRHAPSRRSNRSTSRKPETKLRVGSSAGSPRDGRCRTSPPEPDRRPPRRGSSRRSASSRRTDVGRRRATRRSFRTAVEPGVVVDRVVVVARPHRRQVEAVDATAVPEDDLRHHLLVQQDLQRRRLMSTKRLLDSGHGPSLARIMLIGANLILNDTTLPMREVAPLVEEHGLDALFLGEHTHTPVATIHPQYPGGLPEFYKRFLDPFVQLAVAATVTRADPDRHRRPARRRAQPAGAGQGGRQSRRRLRR